MTRPDSCQERHLAKPPAAATMPTQMAPTPATIAKRCVVIPSTSKCLTAPRAAAEKSMNKYISEVPLSRHSENLRVSFAKKSIASNRPSRSATRQSNDLGGSGCVGGSASAKDSVLSGDADAMADASG